VKYLVPIMPRSLAELAALDITDYQGADIIEWRADFVPLDQIPQMAKRVRDKFANFERLFTYRTEDKRPIDPETYRELVSSVTDFDYVDVEFFRYGHVAVQGKTVYSYHDFQGTSDPRDVLAQLQATDADVIKYAIMPQDDQQVQALLQAGRDLNTTQTLALIAMGPLGRQTRIPGPHNPSDWTFAAVGQASAPGQISLTELLELKHD
jgi:3-dehydroquinate dehydratase-1